MDFKGKKKCRFGVVKQPIYFHFGVYYTKTASRFSSNVYEKYVKKSICFVLSCALLVLRQRWQGNR